MKSYYYKELVKLIKENRISSWASCVMNWNNIRDMILKWLIGICYTWMWLKELENAEVCD